ncbi:unnamed protein product [Phytomonas sp. EM1]|nr:unnamed protein product [Phytomonas sp. EM1]|eukprot:CCW62134.1 unnamed protein product [Phytomonas sp. isolate EM1]
MSSSKFPAIKSATKRHPLTSYSLSSSDRKEKSMLRCAKKARSAAALDQPNACLSESFSSMADSAATKTVNKRPGTQHQTAFGLSIKGSSLMAEKEALLENWRSSMLRYETELRELASCSPSEPPTEFRIIKVLQLYDCITRRIDDSLSPYLAELLRLFRIEFCRAIFLRNRVDAIGTPNTSLGGEGVVDPTMEGDVVTFFEQINSLLHENAHLTRELKTSGAEVNAIELKCDVEQLKGTIKLCENEIERLALQNSHVTQQYWELQDKMAAEKEAHASQVAALEKDLRAVSVENKDLQLRLFRLRKEVTDGKAKFLTDHYRQLKNSKMSFLTTLFSESDERVNLLVLLSQLEFRLNEVLDKYDDKYITNHDDRPLQVTLHLEMQENVVVLLEEMHLCVQQYRRLTCQPAENSSPVDPANANPRHSLNRFFPNMDIPPDETDSFMTMLFDFKIYYNFLAREILQQRSTGTRGGGGDFVCKKNPDVPSTGGLREDPTRPPSHLSAGCGTYMTSSPLDGPPIGHREIFSTRHFDSRETDPHGGEVKGLLGAIPRFEQDGSEELNPNSKNEFIFASRNEWIERMLGSLGSSGTYAGQTPSGLRWMQQNTEGIISPDTLLPRLLRRPLEDLCPRKFISGVEVFAGSDPIQQRYLCSVPRVDPSSAIQLPRYANFIKLKYKSTLPLQDDAYEDRAGESEEITQQISLDSERNDCAAGINRSGDSAHPLSRPNTATMTSPNLMKVRLQHVAKPPLLTQQFSKQASKQISKWGPKSRFKEEQENEDAKGEEVFSSHDDFRVFRELCERPFSKGVPGKLTTRTTGSSTTSVLISFERLNPLSPNRAPEWMLYQTLFGGFRSLIPRILDHAVIDHILLCTCERHFTRMEYRYMTCLKESESRAMNSQMLLVLTERFFREAYELSDFQKSLVDELEARYSYPELVAKTFYEILCFLDAAASHDALYNLYLEVIRGFVSPTHIHFACYMLFNMSYSWPSADPYQVITKDEALAMLRYLYRNADIIVHVDVHEVLDDYERMSRAAPLTLNYMRSYIASIILHQEETMLLYLQGLFRSCCIAEDLQKLTYDNYSSVFLKHWNERSTQTGIVRFLTTTLGFNKKAFLSCDDLALVVASYWASNLLL